MNDYSRYTPHIPHIPHTPQISPAFHNITLEHSASPAACIVVIDNSPTARQRWLYESAIADLADVLL